MAKQKISLPRAELSAADLAGAIEAARVTVEAATYAEIQAMLPAEPGPYRDRVISLIRDLLSGYPGIRYGAPLLIFYSDGRPVDACSDPIPLPLPESPPVDAGVLSIRWLSLTSLCNGAFGAPSSVPVSVVPGFVDAAVLILQCHGDEAPALNCSWWGDVFRSLPGNVVMAGPGTMPWPDALETAAAMLYGAGEWPAPGGVFIGEKAFDEAEAVGARFARQIAQGVTAADYGEDI